MTFRNLRADEIECRPKNVSDKGLLLLLYKDARVDQRILDETFGIYGWTRSHQLIGNSLYCTVSVKNPETGEWISKQDVGTESNMDKEKGLASDSFKRACFNWGIGRELYTAPQVKISRDGFTYNAERRTTYDRFCVSDIEITNGKITYLEIVNVSRTGNPVVFTAGNKGDRLISEKQVMTLKTTLKKHNMPEEEVLKLYDKKNAAELTTADWADFARNGERILKEWDEAHR